MRNRRKGAVVDGEWSGSVSVEKGTEQGSPGKDPESIIRNARTVAVVGLSASPHKPSNEVATYLKVSGYRVYPVHPYEERLLGERVYRSVAEIPERVDVVDVFLRPKRVPEVARDAVRAGVGTLWLQQGITSPEARRIALEGGLGYVEDRCTMQTLQNPSPKWRKATTG